MDKRLTLLLSKINNMYDTVMLDTYDQSIFMDYACTIKTNINSSNLYFIMEKIDIVGTIHKGQSGVVYGQNGIAPTITTNKGDGQLIAEPVVLGWTRDKKGNVINRHPVEVANSVTASKRDNTQNYVVEKPRIRKLTERECFRLMGVADSESDKIRQVVSKTQCYKLAGNSIVVDVLVAIFNQLFSDNKTTDKQLKLF